MRLTLKRSLKLQPKSSLRSPLRRPKKSSKTFGVRAVTKGQNVTNAQSVTNAMLNGQRVIVRHVLSIAVATEAVIAAHREMLPLLFQQETPGKQRPPLMQQSLVQIADRAQSVETATGVRKMVRSQITGTTVVNVMELVRAKIGPRIRANPADKGEAIVRVMADALSAVKIAVTGDGAKISAVSQKSLQPRRRSAPVLMQIHPLQLLRP